MPPVESINFIMYGGALAVIILLVGLLMRGDIVTGREHRAAIEVRDKQIVHLQAEIVRVVAEKTAECAQIAAEKNQEIVLWRDLTIQNSNIADRMVDKLPERGMGRRG
jgi:hypothetical protein